MKYTTSAKPFLKSFCEELNNYFINDKHIELNELKELIRCFSDNTGLLNPKGKFEIEFHSKKRVENGTINSLSEKVLFTSKGYFIKSYSQEAYFGEYYTNDEFTIGDEENEECIEDYLQNALFSIMNILKENNGFTKIKNYKFEIK